MIDNTDRSILRELSENSQITMKELGEKIHLTGPAASARVAKLEEKGIIKGYSINVNQAKLGYAVHAFITVMTQTLHHQPVLAFIRSQEPYIINNYKISGEGCYLLEGQFPSNDELDGFLTGLNEYANYKLSIVIK